MQMIGEYHDRVDDEWALLTSRTQRVTNKINVIHKHLGASVGESDREEKRSAGNEVAPIVDHIRISLSPRPLPAYRSDVLRQVV
jgi:hypothetical protein